MADAPPAASRILLDCDDVLLDWLPGFRRFITEDLGITPRGALPGSFDITRWIGASGSDEVARIISRFNTGADTGFDRLDPIPGAVEAMRRLKKSGYDLHVITSCSGLEAVRTRRGENLEAAFGPDVFTSLTCLEVGVPKHEALATHPRSLWIDDLLKNAITGQEVGHDAAVLKAHHNSASREEVESRGLAWMDDWEDAINQILPEKEISITPAP